MKFVRKGSKPVARPETAGESEAIRKKQESFERLLNPIWNQLARYCHTMAGEQETARDLMSETLLLAFQSFERLRDPSAFKSYLFKIAIRVHLEWSKRAKRYAPLTDELVAHLEHHTLKDDGKSAERSLEVRELYEALETLPVKQREAVMLFEISGLTLKEIQAVQGGSLSGVKSRIVRGRETLARKLGVRDPMESAAANADPYTSSLKSFDTPADPAQPFERVFAFSRETKL